jgi:hypothetical protein
MKTRNGPFRLLWSYGRCLGLTAIAPESAYHSYGLTVIDREIRASRRGETTLLMENCKRILNYMKPVQIKAEYNQALEIAEPLECGSPLPLW